MKKAILLMILLFTMPVYAVCNDVLVLNKDIPELYEGKEFDFVNAAADSCTIYVDGEEYAVKAPVTVDNLLLTYIQDEEAERQEFGKYIVHLSMYSYSEKGHILVEDTVNIWGNTIESVSKGNVCKVTVGSESYSFIDGEYKEVKNMLMLSTKPETCTFEIFRLSDMFTGSMEHIPGFESELKLFNGKQIVISGVSADKKRISIDFDVRLLWFNRYDYTEVGEDMFIRIASVDEDVFETLTSCSINVECKAQTTEETDEPILCEFDCEDNNKCTEDICEENGCRHEIIPDCKENIFTKFVSWLKGLFKKNN